ncbi:MAG: TolC family protein, partial [Lentisphaeria bacterium]
MKNKLIAIGLSGLICGCHQLKITPEPRDNFSLTSSKDNSFELAKSVQDENRFWWKQLQSSELDQLVDQALFGNFEISEAFSRIKQAQQNLNKVSSDKKIHISTEAKAQEGRQNINDKYSDNNQYSLGVAASFELDLWGKLDARESAQWHDLQATKYDLETIKISLVSEITLLWLELISCHQTIELINYQISANKDIMSLVELRFKQSQASALDVLNQQQILSQTHSLLPSQKARKAQII